MNRGFRALRGLGLGVGLMYLLDPDMGNRRRALIRDKFSRAVNLIGEAIGARARDVRNRTYGTIASLQSMLTREAVRDEVIAERVRSRLGFVVRHPGSLSVEVKNGHVTLRGPILGWEVDELLDIVRKVRGVRSVENRLDVHQEPGTEPGLQGMPPMPRGGQFELMQISWSPTARVLAGLTGSALFYYGASRRTAPGTALAVAGATLFARAATNLELKRLVGWRAGRRAIDFDKTMTIAAPREQVFQIWTDYTTFPRLMRHIEDVRETGDGRSRWTFVIPGPKGLLRFHWNVVTTRFIPNEELAWRTEPDSLIQHAGILKFTDNPDGSTTVHLRMTYNPPGGALGHALAALLRSDPKAVLDEEFMWMKSFIETGIVPHDVRGRAVQASETAPELQGRAQAP